MQKFLAGLIIAVLTSDEVQKSIKSLLGSLITERILPLLPVAVGAATKAAIDEIVEKIPALEGVVDVAKTTEAARETLNTVIPDFDLGIPALDNLIDFWRPEK